MLLIDCWRAVAQLPVNYGFPTEQCGSWVHDDLRLCNDDACTEFKNNITDELNNSDQSWLQFWAANHHRFECKQCQRERQRRKRVICCQDYGGLSTNEASNLLESNTFASSVYITEYNQPVCLYAQVRAQMFARHHKRQLFWIQAEDIPPAMHFSEYASSELQGLKKKWLLPTYHARKTQGVLSLLPCALDMPYRLM